LETSVTSSQNGPTYIDVCARATRTRWSSTTTILLARVGGLAEGWFYRPRIHESRKRFSSRGTTTPSERLSLNASRERFYGVPIFSLFLSLSLSPPSPPFLSLPSFSSPIFSAPFLSFAPRFLLPRAKYLAAITRRESRRRCHILAYGRSWIQLHEVSETRAWRSGFHPPSVNTSEIYLFAAFNVVYSNY